MACPATRILECFGGIWFPSFKDTIASLLGNRQVGGRLGYDSRVESSDCPCAWSVLVSFPGVADPSPLPELTE